MIEHKKPNAVYLDAKSNIEAKSELINMCVDTVTPLLPSDIKYGYNFGDEKIVFTKEEVTSIRKAVSEPKLELLGFKPSNMLKFQQNLKHSAFIYPNDKDIAGSSSLFANLLEAMIRILLKVNIRDGQDCHLHFGFS